MHAVDVGDLRIAYERAGSGPSVVLVHGYVMASTVPVTGDLPAGSGAQREPTTGQRPPSVTVARRCGVLRGGCRAGGGPE